MPLYDLLQSKAKPKPSTSEFQKFFYRYTNWFSVCPSRRRYPLPFLSRNNGATCKRTLRFVMDEKSSCFVMQLIRSMLPSNVNFWLACPISRQHLYSRALQRFSTAHSPHVHLQNQNKRTRNVVQYKTGPKNRKSLIQIIVLREHKHKDSPFVQHYFSFISRS